MDLYKKENRHYTSNNLIKLVRNVEENPHLTSKERTQVLELIISHHCVNTVQSSVEDSFNRILKPYKL